MQAARAATFVERQDVRGDVGLQRIGGIVGVAYGAVKIVFAITFLSTLNAAGLTAPLDGKAPQFYDALQARLALLLPLQSVELAVAVIALVFVRALDQRLRAASPTASSTAALFGYAGVALLTLDLGSALRLDQSVAAGTARATVETSIATALTLQETTALAVSLFLGVWLFTVCWIVVRRGGLPRPLGYFGFLAAAWLVVGIFFGIQGFAPLLVSVWQVAAGAVLWFRPQHAEAVSAAGIP